jgi:hypothetical protein
VGPRGTQPKRNASLKPHQPTPATIREHEATVPPRVQSSEPPQPGLIRPVRARGTRDGEADRRERRSEKGGQADHADRPAGPPAIR